MAHTLIQALKFGKGLDPVADALAGTVSSDIFNMEGYKRGLFVVYVGVGATGTSTLTVEACDDVTPTTASAIPFWSREILTGDTEGTMTRRTATGFTYTAGSSKILLCEFDAEDLAEVSGAFGFVRLKAVESVDSPVLASILFIGAEPRYASAIKPTAIV